MPGHLAPGASETHGRLALPSVRPFAPRCDAVLLRPRLTSRSASRRRPFRREARPPQVRAPAFPAQPPDLRRPPLVARASRLLARSPWEASPRIRFLFVGWRLRSPLPSAPASRQRALRFARGPCDQVPRRTCTSWSVPMLGAPKKSGARGPRLRDGAFYNAATGRSVRAPGRRNRPRRRRRPTGSSRSLRRSRRWRRSRAAEVQTARCMRPHP